RFYPSLESHEFAQKLFKLCVTLGVRIRSLVTPGPVRRVLHSRALWQPHLFGSGDSFTHTSSARIFSIVESVRGILPTSMLSRMALELFSGFSCTLPCCVYRQC